MSAEKAKRSNITTRHVNALHYTLISTSQFAHSVHIS